MSVIRTGCGHVSTVATQEGTPPPLLLQAARSAVSVELDCTVKIPVLRMA